MGLKVECGVCKRKGLTIMVDRDKFEEHMKVQHY